MTLLLQWFLTNHMVLDKSQWFLKNLHTVLDKKPPNHTGVVLLQVVDNIRGQFGSLVEGDVVDGSRLQLGRGGGRLVLLLSRLVGHVLLDLLDRLLLAG